MSKNIRKYAAYVVTLMLGLLLGYVFFNGKDDVDKHSHESQEVTEHFTCSMHPQVNQDAAGLCPLCGMQLVKKTNDQDILAQGQFQMTENAMALANIETITVGVSENKDNALNLSGKITANEQTNAVQTSIFNGRIDKLNVNYIGQYIKEGNTLGTMYSPELYSSQDKLLSSQSYRETHEKLYAAARNTLGLWKLTDAQIDAVIKSGKPLMNFPITATVSGTVTEVIGEEGNWYKEGDPLFKVSNLYTVWAVFDAYENQLPKLKIGQEIRISSSLLEGKTYTAKISFIEPILDADRRTVAVRATLINKNGDLKPGMFIEGSVTVKLSDQALTIPKSSVLWTGKRSVVYLKPDPKKPIFEMTEVTLGSANGDSYTIIDGLAAGDEVVYNGTFTVDAAAQLQGKKSMMGGSIYELRLDSENIEYKGNLELKKAFKVILVSYDELKNALIASETIKAKETAKQFLMELGKEDYQLLATSLTDALKRIEINANTIAATDDIAKQRNAFKPLSENMIALASALGDFDQPIYIQHCPMADGNKGASWLSFQERVLNPYFGDAMLNCGSVLRTIH